MISYRRALIFTVKEARVPVKETVKWECLVPLKTLQLSLLSVQGIHHILLSRVVFVDADRALPLNSDEDEILAFSLEQLVSV
jgi:hypothetical protein